LKERIEEVKRDMKEIMRIEMEAVLIRECQVKEFNSVSSQSDIRTLIEEFSKIIV
jgi:ribosomal protein L19E